ncbi:MAG: glycosyltransferase family 39 protein, partial [Acidobacteriota bacterium]
MAEGVRAPVGNGSGPARRLVVWPAAVLLLLLHGALAISSLAVKSVTNDELSHLPAGLAAVATGEIRLNPQHPPLVKLLAGLSASTADPALPLDGSAYERADQWTFGRAVLFGAGNDHRTLLFRGRLPVVALSLLGGLGVFLWSRERFGDGGGLLSLTLFAFSPTVLAHGRLVTMDAAVAAGAVWTLYLWWRSTRAPTSDSTGTGRTPRGRAIACGAALGLTLGAKFSGLLLLPAMALVQGAALVSGSARDRASDRARLRLRGLLREAVPPWLWVLPVAVVVVELLYLLPPDPLRYLRDLGTIYSANDPDAPYYLHGRFRQGGFPHYFAVALAVKTSLAGLAAMAGGLLAAGAGAPSRFPSESAVGPGSTAANRPRWRDDLYLWLPALLWFGVHSAFALDLGVRYLSPVYPLLFVLAGGIVPALGRAAGATPAASRRVRLAALALPFALGLSQVSTALAAHPDYLPFFNRLAGGTPGGIHWLGDSNLDWGQDLARLAPWLQAQGIERPRLLYFGAGVPAAYGVERRPMVASDWWEAPRPGVYVISAQYLIRG